MGNSGWSIVFPSLKAGGLQVSFKFNVELIWVAEENWGGNQPLKNSWLPFLAVSYFSLIWKSGVPINENKAFSELGKPVKTGPEIILWRFKAKVLYTQPVIKLAKMGAAVYVSLS